MCSEVCKHLSNHSNVNVLKNAMGVQMDSMKIQYKKDEPFGITFKDQIIGEDTCDFIIDDIPCVIVISPDKSAAMKIVMCMSYFKAATGIVVIFKPNDQFHPLLIRQYDVSGKLVNEFAGREALKLHV